MSLLQHSDRDEMAEFIGQTVDIFEDYLAEKHISLFSQDKKFERIALLEEMKNGELTEEELQEELDSQAIIYGSLYDIIGNEVWFLDEKFNSLGVSKTLFAQDFVNGILQSYRDTLKEGRFSGSIPADDWKKLEKAVKELYQNWTKEDPEEEQEL